MSLRQGGDYLKYHEGQHGGAMLQGADLSALGGEGLPSNLRASAHLGGLDRACGEIQGLKDQAGGRHKSKKNKKGKKSRKSKSKSKKSRKSKGKSKKRTHRRRHHRRRGGAMGYAPFPSQGMLLDSTIQYAKSGQHPLWNDVEVAAANARASM